MAYQSEVRERAIELFERRVADAQIARDLGVTGETIRRWKNLWRKKQLDPKSGTSKPEKPPKRLPSELSPLEQDEDEDIDTLEHARRARARAMRLSREAEEVSDLPTAQKLLKEATSLSLLIARLEKERNSGNGGILVTQEELAAAEESVREQLRAMAAYPLTCAECGRRLRVDVASGTRTLSETHTATSTHREG